jgi:peptidoglycan/LPS O-acetylase OafA/YrhL
MGEINATTFILAIISPLAVALVRRCSWPKELVELAAALIVVALVVAGTALDGTLTWPLDGAFWLTLAAAFGAQQAAYKFGWRNTAVAETLEQGGEGK